MALAWREVRRDRMVWALQDIYNLAFIPSEVGYGNKKQQ